MLKNTDKSLVVEAIPQPMGAYSRVGADSTKITLGWGNSRGAVLIRRRGLIRGQTYSIKMGHVNNTLMRMQKECLGLPMRKNEGWYYVES